MVLLGGTESVSELLISGGKSKWFLKDLIIGIFVQGKLNMGCCCCRCCCVHVCACVCVINKCSVIETPFIPFN